MKVDNENIPTVLPWETIMGLVDTGIMSINESMPSSFFEHPLIEDLIKRKDLPYTVSLHTIARLGDLRHNATKEKLSSNLIDIIDQSISVVDGYLKSKTYNGLALEGTVTLREGIDSIGSLLRDRTTKYNLAKENDTIFRPDHVEYAQRIVEAASQIRQAAKSPLNRNLDLLEKKEKDIITYLIIVDPHTGEMIHIQPYDPNKQMANPHGTLALKMEMNGNLIDTIYDTKNRVIVMSSNPPIGNTTGLFEPCYNTLKETVEKYNGKLYNSKLLNK